MSRDHDKSIVLVAMDQTEKNQRDARRRIAQDRNINATLGATNQARFTHDTKHEIAELAALCDFWFVLATMSEKIMSNNEEAIRRRLASASAEMRDLALDVDKASEALTGSLERHVATSDGVRDKVRALRMTLTTEVNDTLQALKDVASFVRELEKGGVLGTIRELVEVAARLKEIHGDAFATRLAEALLICSERAALTATGPGGAG